MGQAQRNISAVSIQLSALYAKTEELYPFNTEPRIIQLFFKLPIVTEPKYTSPPPEVELIQSDFSSLHTITMFP
jgi:hypothetical protein